MPLPDESVVRGAFLELEELGISGSIN
jgi:hypothetical protein